MSILSIEYLKTLLALACALEMVIEKGIYDKVIVTRNTPEIAESIGFLPGTEEEKMAPWLAAITDTLEVLHKGDENPVSSRNYIMEKANVQFKSVNFMRGRSIQNAVVILDESQNLTASQLKTIITRCGEGTKLICTGNLAQIDSNYLTPYPILNSIGLLLPPLIYWPEVRVTMILRKSLNLSSNFNDQNQWLLPLSSVNDDYFESSQLKEVA